MIDALNDLTPTELQQQRAFFVQSALCGLFRLEAIRLEAGGNFVLDLGAVRPSVGCSFAVGSN
jgi:hypothetical protein